MVNHTYDDLGYRPSNARVEVLVWSLLEVKFGMDWCARHRAWVKAGRHSLPRVKEMPPTWSLHHLSHRKTPHDILCPCEYCRACDDCGKRVNAGYLHRATGRFICFQCSDIARLDLAPPNHL